MPLPGPVFSDYGEPLNFAVTVNLWENTMAKATTENFTPAAEAGADVFVSGWTRDQQAMALVKSYMPWSAGAGILPLPLVDMVALTAVELRMLSKLSDMYGVPFMENGVKSIVSSLLGTVVSTNVGVALGSLVRVIPVVGTVAGIFAVPSMYTAATYAIGRVFVTHFEAGGTFLDFDPQKTRAYFVAEFEKAKAQPDLAKAA